MIYWHKIKEDLIVLKNALNFKNFLFVIVAAFALAFGSLGLMMLGPNEPVAYLVLLLSALLIRGAVAINQHSKLPGEK